jgi:ATP-dependent Clp protease ATP-binding subunit ClpC
VRARLNNPIKPMGVFLFLGPTGVGKTELVKALAQIVFGGQERRDTRIVRFNMADYSNPYTAYERLFGDHYGRTEVLKQGELYRRLSSQPFTVLLLDEFEKAAPNVYQSFMQLFDEGLMVNAVGDELNMRNSIIVLTSNLGARNLTHQIGFRVKDPIEQAEAEILKESEEYFKPEFINRLDAVCFFKPLSRPVIRQIAQREVQEVIAREGIARQQLRVGVDESVIDLIVERGYDMRFGARYLKRVIERSITYPLARQIARKRLPPGALVRLVARNGDVVVGLIEEENLEIGDSRLEIETRNPQSPISNLQSPKSAKELRTELDVMKPRIERMFEQHDIAALRERVSAMMDRIGDPDFWREPQGAAAQIETMNTLSQRVDQAENILRLWDKCDGAVKHIANTARRNIINKGALVEANQLYRELARELPLVETMLHLRDEQDQASAFVSVKAVDVDASPLAADWMRDVAKMYMNWAHTRGFSVTVLNDGAGEVVLNIGGFGVFALLKGEAGLHRLVRAAPGKRDGERVSVFAQVEVMADLATQTARDIKLESKPIREGGTMVDKLTRQCVLVAGREARPMVWRNALAADELDQQARRFVAALLTAAQTPSSQPPRTEGDDDGLVALADQVRVYTLYKQQSVRDVRTKRASTQPKKVLGGALDEFLLAYLELGSN